jgi:metal-responsive CopG/Arc/MetJ family transcriptional regulator
MSYIAIHLPKALVAEIDELISEHPELGYRGRPEFVKEAVRNKLFDLREKIRSNQKHMNMHT